MALIPKKLIKKSILDNIEEVYKAKGAMWSGPIFIAFMTVALSVMDAGVLYSILDKAMMQNKTMGIIMAFGIALCLNLFPLLAARSMHEYKYKTSKFPLMGMWLSIIGFTVLFAGTVYLRFMYHDMYGTTGVASLVNTVASNTAENGTGNAALRKGIATVILLSIEPLATSIINFILSYYGDDSVQKTKKRYEFLIAEEEGRLSNLKAQKAVMKKDVQNELDADEEEMESTIQMIESIGQNLMAEARRILMEFCQDPNSISTLSHQVLQEQSPDAPKGKLIEVSPIKAIDTDNEDYLPLNIVSM